jgi:hypothetical protein
LREEGVLLEADKELVLVLEQDVMEVDNVSEECGYRASVDVVGDNDIPGILPESQVADCENEDTMEDKKESKKVPEDVNANVDISDNVNNSDKDE